MAFTQKLLGSLSWTEKFLWKALEDLIRPRILSLNDSQETFEYIRPFNASESNLKPYKVFGSLTRELSCP
jgi:hypothetical protein